MSPFRPDLVDCWVFRVPRTGPEILLIRRAPGRILPGLWQCVSGSLDAAYHEVVWPGYRESIARIRDHLLEDRKSVV